MGERESGWPGSRNSSVCDGSVGTGEERFGITDSKFIRHLDAQ